MDNLTVLEKKEETRFYFFNDPSFWFLVVANLITIALALVEGWSLIPLLIVYWGQSIIIGGFNVVRIITHNQLVVNSKSGEVSLRTPWLFRLFFALFFLVHYGIFHFVYLMFIVAFSVEIDSNWITSASSLSILVALVAFFMTHWFSWKHNHKKDEEVRRDIFSVMIYPYFRIIPMHLTIIFGGALMMVGRFGSALFLFLVLKMFMDVRMHKREHAIVPGTLDLKMSSVDAKP